MQLQLNAQLCGVIDIDARVPAIIAVMCRRLASTFEFQLG